MRDFLMDATIAGFGARYDSTYVVAGARPIPLWVSPARHTNSDEHGQPTAVRPGEQFG